ncbi:MAG: Ig-like domain-containing protein [Myxococcaceae bacterium]|nr:Ig-like domain-containing protein [Myxococcaceae bacterium]
MRSGVAVAALAVVLAGCGEQSPASLVYVGFEPAQPKIGDIVTVRFAAVDTRGLPAEGIPVHFELSSTTSPDVKVQPADSSTNKGTGEVITQIIATRRPAAVSVIATAGDKVAQSPVISISGDYVSGRGITFQCGHIAGAAAGIHALLAYGPSRDLIAGTVMDCTAHVADRSGIGIAGASVTFLAEAGAIGPSATTLTDAVGNADVTYKVSLPLPQDVDPGTYRHINPDPTSPDYDSVHIPQPLAPDWMQPWEWRIDPMNNPPPDDPTCPAGCPEPRRADPVRPGITNNPRDNLVTMIAVTAGEEPYVDLNDNGVHDDTEPFVDTIEPFVDANDNGTWDPGEFYVDTNADGSWTGKNGTWDANTLIWAQERILWTGLPNNYDYQEGAPSPLPSTPLAQYIPVVAQIYPAPGSMQLNLDHHGSVSVGYRISDPWFNTLPGNDDGDGCFANPTELVRVSQYGTGATGIRLAYGGVIPINFDIYDAHEEDPPDGGATTFNPPADWFIYPACKVHSSRRDGFEVEVNLTPIKGTVK